MPGLQERYRSDSSSDDNNPKSTKTKQNPTPINQGVAAFNQKTRNKSMYNDNDEDDNDDRVIVEDVNEDEENEETNNHDYSKHGIFGQYTNYGYTSHKTTIDESSIDTDDTVNTNEGMETDISIDQGTRDVPTNTNIDTEVKLPNNSLALSGGNSK